MKIFNFKGMALSQVVLALALSSATTVGVVAYYNTQGSITSTKIDADDVVSTSIRSANEGTTHQLSLNTKTSKLVATNGTVDITTNNCEALRNELLSKDGTVSTCNNGKLTYSVKTIKPLAIQSNSNLVAGVPDSVNQESPDNIALNGNVVVSSSLGSVSTGSTMTSFSSSSSTASGFIALSGGSSGGVKSGSVMNPSGTINPATTCSAGASYIGSTGTYSNPFVKSMNAGGYEWMFPATGSSCGATKANGSFTLSYLGTSEVVNVACTGLDPATHTATDSCDTTQVISFNGGTFQVELSATSRFRQDVAYPGLCPASASLKVTQLSKKPGC